MNTISSLLFSKDEGVQQLEALLFTVKKINAETSVGFAINEREIYNH
jgi:hypothetical protein